MPVQQTPYQIRLKSAELSLVMAYHTEATVGNKRVDCITQAEIEALTIAEETQERITPELLQQLRKRAKHDRSKYMPHQSKRECARRVGA